MIVHPHLIPYLNVGVGDRVRGEGERDSERGRVDVVRILLILKLSFSTTSVAYLDICCV